MPSSACKTCALDRKSTRLNSSHTIISYAVFCLKKRSRAEAGEESAPPWLARANTPLGKPRRACGGRGGAVGEAAPRPRGAGARVRGGGRARGGGVGRSRADSLRHLPA